jgi:integrase
MPRRGRRVRIDTGIYRDSQSGYYSIIVAGIERRMPPGSSTASLYKRKADLLEELEHLDPALTAEAGTLLRDIPRGLKLMTLSDGGSSMKAHLSAWGKSKLGRKLRRLITREDVLTLRAEWMASGRVQPKTVNNRVEALRSLYRALDGTEARTPCDKIKPLPVHRTPAVSVSPEDILAVDERLQEFERRGRLRDAKTRARFRVRASTWRRPSEIMRARPEDVNMRRRIWTPRDGKGGFTPGIYLNDDMLAAWQLFIDADAWGEFDTGSMAEVLRAAGWPEDVRPYNLRHSGGIALAEAGVDMSDVQTMMGHKHLTTTRRHYVPVLRSRLEQAAQLVEGRLPWRQVPSERSTFHVEQHENARNSVEATRAASLDSVGKTGRKVGAK